MTATAGGRVDMANQDFLFCGLELAIIDSTSVETHDGKTLSLKELKREKGTYI